MVQPGQGQGLSRGIPAATLAKDRSLVQVGGIWGNLGRLGARFKVCELREPDGGGGSNGVAVRSGAFPVEAKGRA